MLSRNLVALLLFATATVAAEAAGATGIQNLPGLLGIKVCIQWAPSICSGINQQQLVADPGRTFPIEFYSGVVAQGGLSNEIGYTGAGDEYFALWLPPAAGVVYYLDSVFLFFEQSGSPRYEYPSIALTSVLQFASGSGPADLQGALGPRDGDTVALLSGGIVFAWPSLVPEPTTFALSAFGLMMLSVYARQRS